MTALTAPDVGEAVCKNTSCSRKSALAYCSDRCRDTTRNRGHLGALPDVWVGMDTEREIRARAAAAGMTVAQLLLWAIEREFGDVL